MAYTRSEADLTSGPNPAVKPRDPAQPVKEVVRDLAPRRVPPRSQREWHDIFRRGGDE